MMSEHFAEKRHRPTLAGVIEEDQDGRPGRRDQPIPRLVSISAVILTILEGKRTA